MSHPLRLGIAGLGTIGAALVHIIQSTDNRLSVSSLRTVEITGVTARTRNKERDFSLDGITWFEDASSLAVSEDIDVFVELIGGDEGPARESVEKALQAGKHVVTANKALLAKHGVALAKLAEEKQVSLNYEAAVAGGIPIIKTMREAMSGNKVNRVYGIMNGTCNYILTRMEDEKITFEDCLKDAQRLGYAEADPTFDIGGHDTAHKLSLLTSLAFGCEVSFSSIYLEGIEEITLSDIEAANTLGYRIKLLGVAQETESGIEQRVHPAMVSKESAIGQVSSVTNAVAVEADQVGSLLLSGPGAGGKATASAVVGDIADIARGLKVPVFGRPCASLKPYERARMRLHEGGYYIALDLLDKPGAFAGVATRMAERDISLKSVVQNQRGKEVDGIKNQAQHVVIITHETTEKAISEALESLINDGNVVGKPKMIRIEKLD